MGMSGLSCKWRKATSDSDISSDAEEEESFNRALEREDKEDFKAKVPKAIRKYNNMEKHFRRSLSKEEWTTMLKKHIKPDTESAVPP